MNFRKLKKKWRKFFSKKKGLKIFVICLILALLAILLIYGSIIWKFYSGIPDVVPADQVDSTAAEVQIAQKEQKEDEVINVLLVGTDTRDPNAEMGRSDTMMMLSYNKTQKKSTIVSFLRDSLVEIDGHGKTRLGHAYAYGGVGLTINTLNQTYDLDIQKYATINFDNLVSVIDEIGGVEVFISEEEAEYYRQCGMPDIVAGDVTLTGSQALVHARNRTLGSDFERTRRQRSVMYGVYRKVMSEKDPAAIMSLITYCMDYVKTNMSVTEIYELAMEVLTTENLKMQQAAIPQDGMYKGITYEGMSVLEIDLEANKEYLHGLLY